MSMEFDDFAKQRENGADETNSILTSKTVNIYWKLLIKLFFFRSG